ncbi:hypothetical protein AB0F17_34300 [Nonomuraea sp. NPDC026600]|uniref:hypothetical protein n=1 Tax=Nonomuraea sp. NPDC026600 TaxID=3155363 RepID=UPI00340242D7
MPALPDNATLTYHRAPSHKRNGGTEALIISAHHATTGRLWHLRFTNRTGGWGPPLNLEMTSSNFTAWAQLPELFADLASNDTATLDDVARILDELGATDETAKHARWRDDFDRFTDEEHEAFDFSFGN